VKELIAEDWISARNSGSEGGKMPSAWVVIGRLYLKKPGLGPGNSRVHRCAVNQDGRIR
jgi:hypothetical protein